MRLQVLVAAMHQKDHSLLDKMNIKTDAIVANQCDTDSVERLEHNGNSVVYLNFAERGVGLNRNNALMRADGDLLVFADDDEIFADDYESIIKQAYNELPDADAIVFNIITLGRDVGRRDITKISKLNFFNALNYGTARLTVKNSSIKRCNINFSRRFGGGTEYSSGEDTLFMCDMLKNKLNVYAYPALIASVDQADSTWFGGYDERYFFDRGALFAAISKRYGQVLCDLMLLKNKKHFFENNVISCKDAMRLTRMGRKYYFNNITYADWKEIR